MQTQQFLTHTQPAIATDKDLMNKKLVRTKNDYQKKSMVKDSLNAAHEFQCQKGRGKGEGTKTQELEILEANDEVSGLRGVLGCREQPMVLSK